MYVCMYVCVCIYIYYCYYIKFTYILYEEEQDFVETTMKTAVA